jgi:lipopolysaccharide biosynthesis glycosyltransferase
LEGMACGVPAIVNGNCEVLKGHCERSGAGLYYTNGKEFSDCIRTLSENHDMHTAMADKAARYVRENYNWLSIMDKIDRAVRYVTEESVRTRESSKDQSQISNVKCRAQVFYGDSDFNMKQVFCSTAVAVAFVSSDEYAPCLGVAIRSIIKFSNPSRNYDLVVFSSDMTVGNINQLYSLIKGHENFCIRFAMVKQAVKHYSFFKNSDHEDFTYYRLLVPYFMRNYPRMIYMDSDMVANADIAKAFDTDLGECLLAAVPDPYVSCLQCMDRRDDMKRYLDSLGLIDPGTYFQAGFMVINQMLFNKKFSADELIIEASSNSYIFCDQDVLNIRCLGQVKYLDWAWNVLALKPEVAALCSKKLPKELYLAYTEAKVAPKIIHYADKQLPFQNQEAVFSEYFWECARETPFYELLQSKMLSENIGQQNNKTVKVFEKSNGLSPSEAVFLERATSLKIKFKYRFIMPLVNLILPRGSVRRVKVKEFIKGLRGIKD